MVDTHCLYVFGVAVRLSAGILVSNQPHLVNHVQLICPRKGQNTFLKHDLLNIAHNPKLSITGSLCTTVERYEYVVVNL